ncbi:hypothetical protein [Parageobacillus thermoglucosidasius]|uniref:Uncharacterized protein n=1 Tax=Parageobacillus thermoglucosidasius TaxID=1426 RepID=A0AAN0YR68_PARTM|nr:hypothetical protein [Parageobacillus thermoglucosidasius]KYD18134.1 hypothetical protein B4168_0100 [Anoxybacillus flavithermus]ALF11027.1 hypothetical protein AOT13_13960 [Parageobacillus thermoglucosidasius]ANZ31104.1 hypothetical protein BCV53_13975 [Parageobacillus thermoglucosidasius]APM81841.1 hypothetical protein BCV54_13985 [Parageobacillus thermoglucosidasius]EID44526.1 hypothetical protein GT20_1521 [Parageobacillus thermoglucosidasius TNO-09.020]
MSLHWYHTCCRYHGKVVRIHDKFGNVHIGRIVHVTPTRVYIAPVGARNLGGFGYAFVGWGWGWGWGYGIALAAIAAIALIGLFW